MQTKPILPVTKTESTKAQYRAHFFRLERRARSHLQLGADVEVSPQQIAAMFLDCEPGWSEATARAYRAALVFVFEEMGGHDGREARDMIYHIDGDGEWALQMREKVKAERKRRRRSAPRTSAQKAKKMSPDDLVKLRDGFDKSRSQWSEYTKIWFFAGVLTGLRPSEWQYAQMGVDKKGGKVLIVRNAKNTNGRSHGKLRTLRLGKMPPDDIALIEQQLDAAHMFVAQGTWDNFYFQCRRLLRMVADRLWARRIKHPTLYTARHLFSADAKTKFDRIGVAALMGHASTDTAYQHYGKRHTGTGGMAVSPDEADVQAVTLRNPNYVPEARNTPGFVKSSPLIGKDDV